MTTDLLAGSALIDSEHRQLFAAINSLMEECEKGKGRDSIIKTARFLVDTVKEIENDGPTIASLGKLNAAVATIVSHIRREDKNLATHVKKVNG